jgi:hypothetical protein
MDMETIIFFTISIVCGLSAAAIWAYKHAYSQGYAHGKHCGFTEGLFRAQESMRRKQKNLLNK